MPISKQKLTELVGESWVDPLFDLFNGPIVSYIVPALKAERQKYNVYPSGDDVFRAFRECPYDKIKVVIVGQDPYHTPGMADGLAFSVRNPPDGKLPPSLINIFKELEDDLGFHGPVHNPDLTRWARQGVLLLNNSLTVREGIPTSHTELWTGFTYRVLEAVFSRFSPTMYIGWGSFAKGVIDSHIDIFNPLQGYHHSAHPSPLSAHRGFFGSKPFSRTNAFLEEMGLTPIDWFSDNPEDKPLW